MSFASNVQITTLAASDQAITGRTRLNGLYYTCGSTASTIDLYNGTSATGTPLVSIATPAAAGAHNVIISDGGVLFSEGIYADLGSDVVSASLVYVGGSTPVAPPPPSGTTFGLAVYSPDYLLANECYPGALAKDEAATLQFSVSDGDAQTWIMSLPVGTVFTVSQSSGFTAGDTFTTIEPVTNNTFNGYVTRGLYSGAGYSPGVAYINEFIVV